MLEFNMHDLTIVNLSKKLISLKTDPGNLIELKCALKLCVDQVSEFTIENFESKGISSVLIHNQEKGHKNFKLILNGHLDVIPGKENQYKPYLRNGRLYGVGALDMKSNLSTLIQVFKNTASKVNYPLALQIVTDEEVGGFDGTKYQIDQGIRGEFVISGETTNFNIVNEAKGILWLKISFYGKTAHGAYPWRGENAIINAHDFITKLYKAYPLPKDEKWISTINLASIETSNKTFNKIPDNAIVSLDIRFVPGENKKILSFIKKILPKSSKLEILTNEPALSTPENNIYVQKLIETTRIFQSDKGQTYKAQGSSDARHYMHVSNFGVEFGAVGGGIGEDVEWIDIESLKNYYDILTKFIKSIQ